MPRYIVERTFTAGITRPLTRLSGTMHTTATIHTGAHPCQST